MSVEISEDEKIRLIVVGGRDSRATQFVQYLDSNRYISKIFTSGLQFRQEAPDTAADIVVFWLYTDDMQGHVLAKMIDVEETPNIGRRILVCPAELPDIGASALKNNCIDKVIVDLEDFTELEATLLSLIAG